MKFTHRDQVVLLSSTPIFLIQATFKTGKIDQLLTHHLCIPQILKRMVKFKTLSPLQTYVIMIVQNKHRSQSRTLKPQHETIQCPTSKQSDPFQKLKLTILLSRIFRKMNKVILQAVKTTCSVIQTLFTRRHTDIAVWKCLFRLFLPVICIRHFLFLFFSFFPDTHFFYFFLGGGVQIQILNINENQQKINFQNYYKQNKTTNNHQ